MVNPSHVPQEKAKNQVSTKWAPWETKIPSKADGSNKKHHLQWLSLTPGCFISSSPWGSGYFCSSSSTPLSMMSLFDSLQILKYCSEPSGTVKSHREKMILLPSSSAGHVNLARDPWTIKQSDGQQHVYAKLMGSWWSWHVMAMGHTTSFDIPWSLPLQDELRGCLSPCPRAFYVSPSRLTSWRVFVVWRFERRATNDGQLRMCRVHTSSSRCMV